jgi:hypothetical protein
MIMISNVLLYIAIVLCVVVAVANGQLDPCLESDVALDACLQAAGATNAEKDACDQCIELIAESAGLVTGSAEVCADADTTACGELTNCPCKSCISEAVAKGECEVSDARFTEGSSCDPLSCSAASTTPAPAPAPTTPDGEPSTTPAPLPTMSSATGPTVTNNMAALVIAMMWILA